MESLLITARVPLMYNGGDSLYGYTIPVHPYAGHTNEIHDDLISKILNTDYNELLRHHFCIRPILRGWSEKDIYMYPYSCQVISNAIMHMMNSNRKIKRIPVDRIQIAIDNIIQTIASNTICKKYAIQLHTPDSGFGHVFTVVHIKGRYYILQSYVITTDDTPEHMLKTCGYSLLDSRLNTRINYTAEEIIDILRQYSRLFKSDTWTDDHYNFQYRISGIYCYYTDPDKRYRKYYGLSRYPLAYTKYAGKKFEY